MSRFLRPVLAMSALIVVPASGQVALGQNTEPIWDMKKLSTVPKMTWTGETSYGAKGLYFEGEPYQGKPTRVFAYYAPPRNVTGKAPAMVLVHGGGGAAFAAWADLWAKRGYAAIAMDLNGCGPGSKRLEDGGPPQSDAVIFDVPADGLKDAWPYHAVADVIRAHSLLRSLPEVDADRTGITGISWGGYLTCMTVGIDHRFKVAVPVYGCGFLHENSVWLDRFKKLGPQRTSEWVKRFDPSSVLMNCKTPMLWVNGTNDFAYPLDSYKKSYSLVKSDRTLCVKVRLPHGHQEGWRPKEIGLFVDGYIGTEKQKPFAKVSAIQRKGTEVSAAIASETPIKSAGLHYTTGQGIWKDRKWETHPAKVENGRIVATLPVENGIVFYLSATDDRGVLVCTEHEVLD
jgi:dienelactone hydrolase